MYNKDNIFQNTYKYDEMKRTQHMAVRTAAGWYYYTHQLLEVCGEDAAVFLDRMFANPITNLALGRARYTPMLNEDGIIIDDVVIFRLEENKFWVSTLYVHKMVDWFNAHRGDYQVAYEDITRKMDMYAVQGPKSKELLTSILRDSIEDQKFFTIRDNMIDDIPVKISRAGYTGEKFGYEIYVAPEQKDRVAAKLAEHSPAFGAVKVTDVQVMIWTLPTEKGFYLMVDLRGTNPFEVGFDRSIKWDREFVGKEALLKLQEEGPKRLLMGYTVEEENVHIPCRTLSGPGAPVMVDGEEVGRVTKYTYSYCLEKNIGFALVDTKYAAVGNKVMLNGHEAVLCERVFL